MTSRPRKQAGSKPAATEEHTEPAAADATAKDGEHNPARPDTTGKDGDGDQAGPEPEHHDQDGGNAAGEGATLAQQAAATDMLHTAGEPQPAKVAKGMVRSETGVSPEPFRGGQADTAPTGDTERNGKPTGIGTDTSGELRRRDDATPTAAHGQDARNGHVTGMDEAGQLDRSFGGNGDPAAKLVGSGVRGDRGVGAIDRELPKDERPTYPSTTLTRSSSKAAPAEPDDVKLATQPRLGDPKTSTDPTMAGSGMPSMPGDQTVKLVNRKGEEVKPSDFFDVPDGAQGRNFRRVTQRVSEVYTVRQVKTPSKRLLFTEGQLVPLDVAQTLIELHG